MDNPIIGTPGVNQIQAEKESLLDDYIAEICEMAWELFPFKTEKECIDAVFMALDLLALDRVIEDVPDTEAGEKSEMIWLGKAQTLGLSNLIFDTIHNNLDIEE